MKKIFISIGGVTHEIVDLKINHTGYLGHNFAKNQKLLDSIDYVFTQEDKKPEIMSKKKVKKTLKKLKKLIKEGAESCK